MSWFKFLVLLYGLGWPSAQAITPSLVVQDFCQNYSPQHLDLEKYYTSLWGNYWKQLDPNKREKLSELIKQNLTQYIDLLRKTFPIHTLKTGDAAIEASESTVTAKAMLFGKERTITFKLHNVGNTWKIYLILIDGLENLENLKAQAQVLIQIEEKLGFENLIAILSSILKGHPPSIDLRQKLQNLKLK